MELLCEQLTGIVEIGSHGCFACQVSNALLQFIHFFNVSKNCAKYMDDPRL